MLDSILTYAQVGGIVYYVDKNFFPDDDLLERLSPPVPDLYPDATICNEEEEESDDYPVKRRANIDQAASANGPLEEKEQHG